ncbi:MAG: OmpA family protein [Bacteroidia bacterium]|nr:OmpA family protein [Bacteroidia bacterium]NNC86240.1 OmpA family protein [Bacteroidia bacterium]NNM16533.1 OmpA family protein [Bacteroidia bacterium]
MLKQSFLIQLFVLCSLGLYAQNLVPNPGFEEFYNCPDKLSQFHNVINWYTPTIGNPDYYNNCKERKADPFGVPYNIYGVQQPKDGNGYCGLVLHNVVNNRLVEYVQIKLDKPLKANSHYQLSFYVSLSENSKFAINTVEACVSKDALNSNFWEPLLQMAQVRFSNTFVLDNKDEWVEVKANFSAEGGEQYLSIGNFAHANQTVVKQLEDGDKLVAYYYIDKVQLIEIPKPVEPFVAEVKEPDTKNVKKKRRRNKKNKLGRKPNNIKKNDDSGLPENVMSVDPVYFKYNSTELVTSSYPELDQLVELLNTYSAMGLIIRSHTDGSSKEKDNMQLARDRADAVVEYLLENNISRNRIKVECLGSANPVSNNQTVEGRQKNRRIEFLITRLPQ